MRLLTAKTAVASLALASVIALSLAMPPAASAGVPQSPPGWSRAVVLQNAQRWVDQRVPYSQTSWYRGYRQDCSGFVSMAWNIHASYPTGMMDQIAKPIPKSALLPGDVLLNNSSTGAHVVLFVKWAYTDKSYYWGYEQLSSTNRPVKRLIPYPYFRNQRLYRPYRFTGLPPKPAAPKAPAMQQVAVKKAVDTSAGPVQRLGVAKMSLRAWQFALMLALAGAGGLAWGLTGRFLR